MPTLIIPSDLTLPERVAPVLGRLSLELATHDGMYKGNDRHYLMCGASALNVVLCVMSIADVPHPASVLDFGSGAGRVTRWLRAAFPESGIHTCDLREEDLQFNSDVLGFHSWQTSTDISVLKADTTYDLIWVGSVLTHLSAPRSEELLRTLFSWTNPNGLVVASLHGRYAKSRHYCGFPYITEDSWPTIELGYQEIGYGYADYPGQLGYGISLSKPSWASSLVEKIPEARMVLFAEKAWDDHHDVVAIQRRDIA